MMKINQNKTYDPQFVLSCFKKFQKVMDIANKLDILVRPDGGYAMDYDIKNLPNYPLGLFGAVSVVLGKHGRTQFGLTYEETLAVETAFNTGKIQNKYLELEKIGIALRKLAYGVR